MSWFFRHAEDVAPDLVEATVEERTSETESTIVETAYTGCAWCGDGDGNGLCSSCEETYFPRRIAQG